MIDTEGIYAKEVCKVTKFDVLNTVVLHDLFICLLFGQKRQVNNSDHSREHCRLPIKYARNAFHISATIFILAHALPNL